MVFTNFIKIVMAAAIALSFAIVPAEAAKKRKKKRTPRLPPIVQVNIDISSQAMSVRVNGWPTAYWKVSTGRQGYYTPRGTYGVTRTAKTYFSKKYDNAPMPHSVFFYGGYAIHGTGSIRALGRPASHGCVRLHPANAAKLYALVQQHGPRRTRITLTN
jgi:lipoprotein-anchoring transpeptidase ErfK/SrfK